MSCTKREREIAFEQTFMVHAWGNKNNSGKGPKGSYKRPYSKTKNDKGLISKKDLPGAKAS